MAIQAMFRPNGSFPIPQTQTANLYAQVVTYAEHFLIPIG